MSGEHEMWRCRECGKWSHAKRRPTAHERAVEVEEDGEVVGRRFVWCGPFDRHVAVLAEPTEAVRDRPGGFGHPSRSSPEYFAEDPNEGIEVPF